MAEETLRIWKARLRGIWSNTPEDPRYALPDSQLSRRHTIVDMGEEDERETRHGPRHASEVVHRVGDPGNRHDPEGESEGETDNRGVPRTSAVECGHERNQRDGEERKNREVRETQCQKET